MSHRFHSLGYKSRQALTLNIYPFQEAARDFADIGKDIPREIDISVELSPSERMIDFITFRYVPLAAVALLVLVIGVLYLVYRSYIRAKSEFQRVTDWPK